jgi:hypothetical protein
MSSSLSSWENFRDSAKVVSVANAAARFFSI